MKTSEKNELEKKPLIEQLDDKFSIIENDDETYSLLLGLCRVRNFKNREEAMNYCKSKITLDKIVEIASAVITIYDKHYNKN